MQVIILAGGLGTRMSEETDFIPKPMSKIGKKPILWHLLKYYNHFGFKDFVICSGYKSKIIKSYFNNEDNFLNSINVKVVFTGKHSNTGERIKRVQRLIKNDFMLTYGDGISNVNITSLLKKHKNKNFLVTLTAVKPEPRFGKLTLKGNKVLNFSEKKNNKNDWINGGFMVCNKKIFSFIKKKNSVFESDILDALAKKGKLQAYKHKGFWQPVDTLKEKRYLNIIWLKKKAPWKIWKN